MTVIKLFLFVFLLTLISSSTSIAATSSHHIFARKGAPEPKIEVSVIKQKPSVSKYMMKLYKKGHLKESHNKAVIADTIRGIKVEQVIFWKGSRGSLAFSLDLHSVSKKEIFHGAELVLTPKVKLQKRKVVNVRIFNKVTTDKHNIAELEEIDSRRCNPNSTDFLKLDLTQLFKKWAIMDKGIGRKVIEIEVESFYDEENERPPKISHMFYRSDSRRPFIVLYTSSKTDDTFFGYIRKSLPEVAAQLYNAITQGFIRKNVEIKVSRKRRSIVKCGLRNYYLSFKDILQKKNYVIAPSGFKANFCDGACSWPLDSDRMHTVLMAMAAGFTSRNTPTGPKCVADKWEDVQLLYYDENQDIVLKKFQNMRATHCSCV